MTIQISTTNIAILIHNYIIPPVHNNGKYLHPWYDGILRYPMAFFKVRYDRIA